MKEFTQYADDLSELIEKSFSCSLPIEASQKIAISSALNGGPAQALRDSVSVDKQRQFGAFFTGSELAHLAIEPLIPTFTEESIILDIACGAGDLLIACAKHLPKGKDLESTLALWETRIIGHDIHSEFINVTKFRLILTALNEGIKSRSRLSPQLTKIFPEITKVEDGLRQKDSIQAATHIIINPPFIRTPAPQDCSWTGANVNSAALFLERCVMDSRPGTRIVAILPDVLRSGTNYKKWRRLIASRSIEHRIQLYGQFDKWADVDVFVLDLEVIDQPEQDYALRWNKPQLEPQQICIRDKFRVHVGRVVENRDAHQGNEYPYLMPKDLPQWETIESIDNKRRFSGKTYQSPFVVVRRTSRRGHRYRAVGTVINIVGDVAVENHLMVLVPKSGSLKECENLIDVLKNPKTNDWLNERILCRHLTVTSLEEIPWWGEEYD